MMDMDLSEYVDALQHDFVRAATAMGPEAAQVAERLGFALDSAARLAFLDALSQAAAEITGSLDATSVELRLHGRDPVFVVVGGVPALEMPAPPATPPAGDDGSEETARITLRLPEALKSRAEELAGARGQSLNTWIVGAIREATQSPAEAGARPAYAPTIGRRNRSSSRRVQGWVR